MANLIENTNDIGVLGLQYVGSRPSADQWAPDWLAESPVTAAVEVEILEPEASQAGGIPEFESPAVADGDNEFFWANISPRDFAYLTAPLAIIPACPWCGGRTKHTTICDELRTSFEPVVPWGKHKGKSLSQVPVDYLEWLVWREGITSELRDAINVKLGRGAA